MTGSEDQNIEGAASKQSKAEHTPLVENNLPLAVEQPTTEQQPTENPANQITTDTQPMEVHHPHHPTHKKKWSEYLLEFFMLFLAVFLGFLVENFREHRVEVERAGKHMHTMVENLKYDTTRLQKNLRLNLEIGRGLDSFRHQIMEAIQGRVNANRLYYYCWRYGKDFGIPKLNAAAMTQLKSSGMLRMVTNDALVNEMGDYYERLGSTMVSQEQTVQSRQNRLNDAYKSIFSYMGFDELLQRDTIYSVAYPPLQYYNGIRDRNPPLKLLTSSPAVFQFLYNEVATYEEALRLYDAYIRYCKEGADSLMVHINKEYDFETATATR